MTPARFWSVATVATGAFSFVPAWATLSLWLYLRPLCADVAVIGDILFGVSAAVFALFGCGLMSLGFWWMRKPEPKMVVPVVRGVAKGM